VPAHCAGVVPPSEPVVIVLVFFQLARQVHGVPEEYSIKVLMPDRSDQPFDKRMRDRSVRNRLDLLDLLSLRKNMFGLGIGLQMVAAEFMGRCVFAGRLRPMQNEWKLLAPLGASTAVGKCRDRHAETGASVRRALRA
jgi:hypothetical protein